MLLSVLSSDVGVHQGHITVASLRLPHLSHVSFPLQVNRLSAPAVTHGDGTTITGSQRSVEGHEVTRTIFKNHVSYFTSE